MNQETTINPTRIRGRLSWQEAGILLIHALIGWALCTASMGVSMAVTTVENALIIHASAAPIIYFVISLIYFNKFNYTRPLQTGLIFVGFVIFMDFFVVAMLVLKSFEMFYSPLGTWIPFGLILATTVIVGTIVSNRRVAQ